MKMRVSGMAFRGWQMRYLFALQLDLLSIHRSCYDARTLSMCDEQLISPNAPDTF